MIGRAPEVSGEIKGNGIAAGCQLIDYGSESGDPGTLKRIHKPHSVEMVRRVIPMTHRHGIRSSVFTISTAYWMFRRRIA